MGSVERSLSRSGCPPGKLKAAARAWAHARLGRADNQEPIAIDNAIRDQFSALGVEVEAQIAPPEAQPSTDFEIMAVNWQSVCAFLACETQWRALPVVMGQRGQITTDLMWLGLDYAAVDIVLRRSRCPEDVFADLQLMERAALDAFGEGRE